MPNALDAGESIRTDKADEMMLLDIAAQALRNFDKLSGCRILGTRLWHEKHRRQDLWTRRPEAPPSLAAPNNLAHVQQDAGA